MRVGAGPGPDGAAHQQSSHYVYDLRSGVILATYHFVGAAPKSESDRLAAILKSSHETSSVPIEHLAVLTTQDVPPGEGELHVDHVMKKLVRKRTDSHLRTRP
jgi:hypothetical protein